MERARDVDAPCPAVADGIIDLGREGLLGVLVGEDQDAGHRVVMVRQLLPVVVVRVLLVGQDQVGQDQAGHQAAAVVCLLVGSPHWLYYWLYYWLYWRRHLLIELLLEEQARAAWFHGQAQARAAWFHGQAQAGLAWVHGQAVPIDTRASKSLVIRR